MSRALQDFALKLYKYFLVSHQAKNQTAKELPVSPRELRHGQKAVSRTLLLVKSDILVPLQLG